MNIFKINNDDRKYNSIYDEIKRKYSRKTTFSFDFPLEKVFEAILQISLLNFKKGMWMKITDLKVGDVYEARGKKKLFFKVTKLEFSTNYELLTKREGVKYFTEFIGTKITDHKSKIHYVQSVINDKTIAGLPGQLAKIQYRRKVKHQANIVYTNLLKRLKEFPK